MVPTLTGRFLWLKRKVSRTHSLILLPGVYPRVKNVLGLANRPGLNG